MRGVGPDGQDGRLLTARDGFESRTPYGVDSAVCVEVVTVSIDDLGPGRVNPALVMAVRLMLAKEAIATVALSHDDLCDCFVCRAAIGDDTALVELLLEQEPPS
jgi:hypothetical protein